MTKYFQVVDGEGFTMPNRTIFSLACCDCKLVHDVVISVPKLRRGRLLG